jgi:hypothetical protein
MKMKIKSNTTGSSSSLEKIAIRENKIFIRVFFPNGKFINYLIDPQDVEQYGMGTIFEVIDPDPDWQAAKEIYSNVQSKPKDASKIAA